MMKCKRTHAQMNINLPRLIFFWLLFQSFFEYMTIIKSTLKIMTTVEVTRKIRQITMQSSSSSSRRHYIHRRRRRRIVKSSSNYNFQLRPISKTKRIYLWDLRECKQMGVLYFRRISCELGCFWGWKNSKY